MSWFSTARFHFELPDNNWVEKTNQAHQPVDSERSAFVISRQPRSPDGLVPSLRSVIESLPSDEVYQERTVLSSSTRQVGPLEAQDASAIARSHRSAEYFRIVCVEYYDLLLSFQWVGPVPERESIDAMAEQMLASTRFRRR
jgi:hypothetical protein